MASRAGNEIVLLEDLWRTAATDLSLDVVIPYPVVLPSGGEFVVRVFLKDFGGRAGMLIDSDYKKFAPVAEELRSEGYGFTVLRDPRVNGSYRRTDLIEMLEDWSWTGKEGRRPDWLT